MKNSILRQGVVGLWAAGLALGCSSSEEGGGGGEGARAAGERAGTRQMLLKPTGAFLVLASPYNQIAFDALPVGNTTAPRSLLMRNDGTASLTISTVTITGAHAADFTLGTNTTCTGATLAPAGTCAIEVSFTAGAPSKRVATIEIANDAAGNTHEIPVLGRGLPTTGFTPTAGPIDPRYGFPAWYQDGTGLKLEPCVEDLTLCPNPLPDLLEPPSIVYTFTNFPDEAFYWLAEAELRPTSRIRARLALGLEATFGGTGDVTIGEQIVFGRVRLRLEGVTPSVPYTFTHPFGSRTLTAGADGKIDLTEDIGCGSSPCDFRQAFNSEVVKSFLKWDPAFTPLAPAGYIGNPNVDHRIVGSPTGNNLFKVEGTGVGGGSVFTIQTNLFSLSGKLLP
jgi:hypothetical protein